MNKYDPNYKPTFTFFLVGVKVVVYNPGGKVLLLKRSDKTSRAGGWDFCGGGVDDDEVDVYETAKREVLEEAGIRVGNLKIVNASIVKDKKRNTLILGFTAKAKSSNIKLSWEHSEYKWVDKDAALRMGLPGIHSEILKQASFDGNK